MRDSTIEGIGYGIGCLVWLAYTALWFTILGGIAILIIRHIAA